MARTVVPKKPKVIIERAIDYNEWNIARMSDGTFRIWYDDETDFITVDDVKNGKAQIDRLKQVKAIVTPVIKRGNRTIVPKAKPVPEPKAIILKEEFPRGGCIKGPVDSCKKKFKFESGSNYWVDACVCAFHCVDNISCPTYRNFMAGRKDRIRQIKE